MTVSLYFRLLLSYLLLCSALSLFAQNDYSANDHVGYRVAVVGEDYVIRYTFRDHRENTCSITWKLNKEQTDRDIQLFGIPQSMFDPYPVTPEVLAARRQILEKGLFMRMDNSLVVDKNAMVNAYSPYTKIVANWMIDYLKEYYSDTRRQRIELAMRFVQDIPYGIPEDLDPNWYYGGVIATPNVFTCGYGDCDTKAILFAGILCHLIDPEDIRFAGEPGHMYTIVKADASEVAISRNTAYFELDDGMYFVGETAGPGRLNFGEKGRFRYRGARIEEVDFVKR